MFEYQGRRGADSPEVFRQRRYPSPPGSGRHLPPPAAPQPRRYPAPQGPAVSRSPWDRLRWKRLTPLQRRFVIGLVAFYLLLWIACAVLIGLWVAGHIGYR